MSRKKAPQPTQPKALPEVQADPGPLLLAIGINRVTARLTFCGNQVDERDLTLLADALRIATANVQQQLIAAAEARGAAAAKTAPAAAS